MKQSKRALIWRFLKPYAWIFALTLALSMANTVLGSLTPQVVRVAVDCVHLSNLEDGKWRELSPEKVKALVGEKSAKNVSKAGK